MARPLGQSHIHINRPDLGITFGKSRRSNIQNCLFAAATDDSVILLDSKDEQGPVLAFSKQAWTTFAQGVDKLHPLG